MKEGPSLALCFCHTQLPSQTVVSLFALGHPQTLCTREEDRLTRSSGISLPPKESPECRMLSRMTIPESLGKGAVRMSGWNRPRWNLAWVKSHRTISTLTWHVHVFDVSVSVLRCLYMWCLPSWRVREGSSCWLSCHQWGWACVLTT